MDDVLIFSKSAEEHLKHIEIVLKKIHDQNMNKCSFFQTSAKFLGYPNHAVAGMIMQVDDDGNRKIVAICSRMISDCEKNYTVYE